MTEPAVVRVTGPLTPYARGFWDDLAGQGYLPSSIASHLRLMAHVSRWLANQGLRPEELTPERAEAFLEARRAEGYSHLLSQRGLAPLLGHLRRQGVVPPVAPGEVHTPLEELFENYQRYLFEERGLDASTVRHYMPAARSFLVKHCRVNDGELHLDDLAAAEVAAFVVAECAKRSVGSAKNLVSGLRSVLRFLHLRGLVSESLAWAVPSVAGWREASLPRALPSAQVQRLLSSCDRSTAVGQRDFAVLMLLARLGLRAGEVAALELDDIDWRAGEVVVRGKGRREERLPLPVDVGAAIVRYLQDGRPLGASRGLFMHVRAPQGPMSYSSVHGAMGSACRRAGLPQVGPHRLRHSAATEMLRAGAGLAEVGQVLRHRELSTTAIYAKVDRTVLRGLALPWPGAGA